MTIMSIYVGNLSPTTTEEEVRNLFTEFGAVESVNLLTDRYTGESRGFGFVKMYNKAALAAIEALSKRSIDGRTLKVSEAKPREPGGGFRQHSRGGAFGGGGGGGRGRY
ncbi:MAG TPA: RNA-binding protein [Gammaproteobacteria bacterium]|nr:RNA-binding protein [Gammaproteobacteria bacterium]